MVIHLVFHKQHGQIHLNVHLLFRISWKNYMCPPMLSYKAQICLCRHFTQRVARYRHNNQASGKEISRVKNWWPDLWGKVIKKNVGYRIFSINTKLLLRGRGAILLNKLTDPLYLIFGKLYFSDILKKHFGYCKNTIESLQLNYVSILLIIISYIIIDIPKH